MQQTFRVFAEDEYISKCRRLFMIFAASNRDIGEFYVENFIGEPIAFNTRVFDGLIRKKGLAHADAEVMAYQFYSPVFCLLQEYDNGRINIDSALEKVEKITRGFSEAYNL